MRELGDRVGMRAQSVYSYFASKHDVYDAMFHDGNVRFGEHMASALDELDDATTVAALTTLGRAFVDFCTIDPVRHQLLFQRTIPGFEPSAESYAAALDAYEQFRDHLRDVGITDQATLDLWSATLRGLADQQISNEPGGDRWSQLVGRAVEMLLADARSHHPIHEQERS